MCFHVSEIYAIVRQTFKRKTLAAGYGLKFALYRIHVELQAIFDCLIINIFIPTDLSVREVLCFMYLSLG